MGSRVGFHCFGTAAEASDYYYSQQSIISLNTESGAYAIFQKKNDKWYQIFYNGSPEPKYSIEAANINFPKCDPFESFIEGAQISYLIVLCLFTAYGFKLIKDVIRRGANV